MDRKFLICCALIVIIVGGYALDDKKISDEKNNNLTYDDELKMKFGCTPTYEFELIRQNKNGGHVEAVCLPKTYQINKPPDIDEDTMVVVVFYEKRILEIDERKKSITLLIEKWLFWEDRRIKIQKSLAKKSITLPAITSTNQYIWTPFPRPVVLDLKEISPVYESIVSQPSVWMGLNANDLLSKELFSPDEPVLFDIPMWKIKIFCRFDFSEYPFDRQNCSFQMVSFGLNLTVVRQKDWGYKREEQQNFGGYDLKMKYFHLDPWYDSVLQQHVGFFGFHITLTRQIETYIFQYYLPCMAIVVISIFSFIIPLTAIPGRVMIVVTQFLTLTNLFSNAMVSK